MGKKLVLITIVLWSALFLAGITGVLAQPDGDTAIPPPHETESFEELLTRITNVLLIVAIPAFTAIIAFAAYHLVVSKGVPEKRRLAGDLLKWGFIGFLVIVFSRAIVAIVFSFFSSETADAALICPLVDCTSLELVIGSICLNLLIYAALLYVIMIIIGGFYFMFGGANPHRRLVGRKTLLYSTIGFVVVTFSCSLPAMIRAIF